MAAPATKNIGDLAGKWVMNKTLSDSPEPALALQGVGWVTRKAIGLSTVTLQVTQYKDEKSGVAHIDIEQTATGGIKGTAEHRTLDGEPREHSDWLFGNVHARSSWLAAAGLPGAAEKYGEFITAGWLEEGEGAGPAGESHVLNYVEADAGWNAVQIWGFQTIGGERRYARNIKVYKGEEKVEIRFIYDFVPAEE